MCHIQEYLNVFVTHDNIFDKKDKLCGKKAFMYTICHFNGNCDHLVFSVPVLSSNSKQVIP